MFGYLRRLLQPFRGSSREASFPRKNVELITIKGPWDGAYRPFTIFSDEEADQHLPDRELVFERGDGEFQVRLYRCPKENIYLRHGPYGRWDGICYEVCEFTDDADAKQWMEAVEQSLQKRGKS